MTRWPDAVWRSPWLRGIDEVARDALEAAGRVHALDKGARVFAVGEPADAFFVVGEGLVEVRAVRRGETEARAIRRAVAGDALGEDAILRAGVARAAEATCATRVVVAEVPVAVFRRAASRAGAAHAGAMEEALRRAAGRDVLRSSSLGHGLSDADVEALLASSEARALVRDEVLFEAGDPATHVFVVADGMVQVREEADGKLCVQAYLARGDLVAQGALESGGAHDVTAAACGPAWVLAIPREDLRRIVRRARGGLDHALRLAPSAPLDGATRHVLGDLWRFAVAGSMLVIDDETCVRCGHCAASCASVHGDGVSRLVRRGEKIAVRDAVDGSSRALIVPGSCQHCKHPACMIDCPTGAIGRDPRGSVFVREELCVGCGRCEAACPWGSVHMAPRPAKTSKHLPVVLSADVAVKCDLCSDVPSGPACVSACPVEAIGRIEPVSAIAEVRKAVGGGEPRRSLPRARAAWPWVTGAAAIAAALTRVPSGGGALRMTTGLVAGLVVVALTAYAVLKRRGRRGEGRKDAKTQRGKDNQLGAFASLRPSPSRVRPHAIAHMALGTLAVGVVAAHAGTHLAPNAAGALLVAFAVASVTGIAGAIVYRLAPPALSRVERRALLAEDLPGRARDLDDRAFGALTGRSEATKAVYARWLAPYARAPVGAIAMVARRRTLRDEERALRARIEGVVGARTATLDGLEDLVRLVVERRAVRAQRMLQGILRGWLPVHVAAVAITVALLAVHVVLVTRGR